MDTGKQIEAYHNGLIDLTNVCGLSIGTAYYVAKDFLRELEKSYINSMAAEKDPETVEETVVNDFPETAETSFESVSLG